jgi:ABC-type nitrate/sulfonate/bicarbonate transport system permease component
MAAATLAKPAEHRVRAAVPARARLPLARTGVVLAALGLWQLLVASGALPASAVAAPWDVAKALGPMVAGGPFWSALGDTAASWGAGLAISLLVAIPVGLLLGASALLYRMSRFTIDFLRTIPPIALIPLALLEFGATPRMALLLIVFGSLWPILLQSMYGLHQVDPMLRDVARTYHLGLRRYVGWVVLPSAAPFVATGVRVAATMSLLLAIGAELLGGAPGIGAAITSYQDGGSVPQMWALVLVSGLLGVLLNLGLLQLERRVLRWHPAHRPAAD